MTQTQRPNGRADFDFEIGHWQAQRRHLKHVLQGPTNWEEFTGISVARKILGGLGLLDEISNERAKRSFQGITLHFFEPQTQQWSVYPANSTQGVLAVPMNGGFTNGRGVSYSHVPIDGSTVCIASRASSGMRSPLVHICGSRPIPRMAALPGRRTGSRVTLAYRSHRRRARLLALVRPAGEELRTTTPVSPALRHPSAT